MRRGVVLAFGAGALLALAAVAIETTAADDAASPPLATLTNEDIVRMVSAGTPEQEILIAIRTHPERLDLSNEMDEELKLAGVPEKILTAMRQRHVELAPPPPPPAEPKRGRTPLIVTLNPGGGGRTLRVPSWADEDAKQEFQLPKENDQRHVKDLAVFLGCVTSEHVPDMWRSKSPLGRDMRFVVRHEMLAFVAGETPPGQEPRLVLPARVDAEVEEGVAHELVFGVAALFGDRWVELASARLPKTTIGAGAKPLVGHVKNVGRGFTFKVDLSAN